MAGTVLSLFGSNPQRIGGIESFARELSEQLNNAGWQSVLCFLSEPSDLVRRFLSGPNVAIETLPEASLIGWKVLRQTSQLMVKHRPGIVHTHFTGHLSFRPWLGRLHSVRAQFFTDHLSRCEGHVVRRAPLFKRVLSRFLNEPLTNVVAVSNYNARVCAAAGLVASNRVKRIYNGVDPRRNAGDAKTFRQTFGIPEDRSIVLQVSWMIPQKGIEDLLQAARLVLARNSRVQFVMVGEGASRGAFMEATQQAGIADHFTWTGLMDDPIVGGAYAAATVVCQLSRWEEAFGWTNTEAMACGRPLVATRVGGVPEIVENGVSGFLVGSRRPEEAAARILQLLADPALCERLAEVGRLVVADRFHLQRNVGELVRLYGIPNSN
ncbi:MAG: L-malate glycosyltransferase [Bryobacterales bacterium]|jgi:glycosyltransferase involved in cell wall biosynthesis|nr:L-malate glycosyltransferase [Bryobacterales bacterium]